MSKEIDEIFDDLIFAELNYYPGDYTEHEAFLKAKAAIFAWARARVPEIELQFITPNEYASGWNDCRKAMLKAFKE